MRLPKSSRSGCLVPRKEKTCPDCLNKGYVSLLGWRTGDGRKLIPCDCKHGRQFLRLMRQESPPTESESGPVDS